MNTSHILAVCVVAMVFAGGPARAQEQASPRGVVELFTSQGCSSCPPADAVLDDLAEEGSVLALAYHITYWDYLGWKDTLGSEANTKRQYDYMKSFRARSVYTPQAVINGRTHVNGGVRAQIAGSLAKLNGSTGLSVRVLARRSGDHVIVETGAGDAASKAQIVLVTYEPTRSVKIERGENAGKTVVYRNAVSNIQTLGAWHGKQTRLNVLLPQKPGTRCAVLVQAVTANNLPGAIVGAAVVDDPKS
ncbi:DUF1223 domain-containing protein [Mesorhizobium sp. NBSH29]|uniref:DUF1223 domain-containing protein n=1 Tax=Mesorhizobium sp. NBSH29 TaxID=2654249 RepID=UPI0018967889|nr:DUF1223 domain-containing protein [Mesorhizobium sp. NBSH29]QPC86012.1 DUF1223 domain-containing protein [Mesorhizobium sp. NBSH29]